MAIKYKIGELIPGTRLSYQGEAPRTNPSRRRALYLCQCGETINADLAAVRHGSVSSCGCLKKETVAARNKTHGNAERNNRSGAYKTWTAMHQRCRDHETYKNVSVCPRWSGPDGFTNFLKDMGPRPTNYTIERKDRLKDYEPSNCIWAGRMTQAANLPQTRSVVINGKSDSIAGWCRTLGIGYHVVKQRRQRGMSLKDALTTPLDPTKQGRRIK